MDPTVPSSKKFLLQLPGYKPTKREKRFDESIYSYALGKMQGGSSGESKFDAQKNELCEQEQYILNTVGFELDTFPIFMDVTEILMAQGVLYTSDFILCGTNVKPVQANEDTISLVEKYVDLF